MTPTRDEYHVRAVDRALDVLDVFFDTKSSELGLGELAQMLKIHKSTVHRMAVTLVDRGYLAQNQTTGKYRLGIRMLQLGTFVKQRIELRTEARQILEEVVQETGESAYLTIMMGNTRVCIDKVECSHPIRCMVDVGSTIPLYTGAGGKVILAYLPETQLEEVLSSLKLEKLAANTITDLAELRLELANVREWGYAITEDERLPESFGVGAPIFGADGECVAALSIGCPRGRITPEVGRKLIQVAVIKADQISRRLGYIGEEIV